MQTRRATTWQQKQQQQSDNNNNNCYIKVTSLPSPTIASFYQRGQRIIYSHFHFSRCILTFYLHVVVVVVVLAAAVIVVVAVIVAVNFMH